MQIKKLLLSINSVGFIKHSKFYFFGNMFSKALNVLFMPIFTRLLTTSEYGIIAIYQSMVNILAIIATLGLEQAVRHFYLQKNNEFKEFTGTILNFLLLFNIVFVFILILIRNPICNLFDLQENLFSMVLIQVSFTIGIAIYNMYIMASKRSKEYMFIQLIVALFIPVLSIIFMLRVDEGRYMWRIIPQVVITSIIGIYVLYSLAKISSFCFKWSYIKIGLKYSLPLMPHFLATFALSQFDRIAINNYIDSSATGIYSFAYSIGFILQAAFTATNGAWLPIFYKNLKEKSYDFLFHKMISYIKIIFIFSAALIAFSQEAVWILADSKFVSAIQLLPVILLGITLSFLFTIYISYIYFEGKTSMVAILTISSGAINIILNMFFIPLYGIIAAAYTTLVSYFALVVFCYALVRISVKEKNSILPIMRIMKPFVILVLFTFAFQFLYSSTLNYLYVLPLKLVLGTIFLYIYIEKDDVSFVQQLMQNKESEL